MNVFKFGGASVKDAEAVKNVIQILKMHSVDKLGVVISAMGKTTNAMETIVDAINQQDEQRFLDLLNESKTYHFEIVNELFEDKSDPIFAEINRIFTEIESKYASLSSDNFDYNYDQVVSYGEIIATKIVAAFAKNMGIKAAWLDARKLIRTDNKFREAEIDWNKSTALFQEKFMPAFEQNDVLITQGFIGHTSEGLTTTLGREGSDFSAGIMAFCCDAKSVTIWKDVPGMLNADPRRFENTVKLDRISFREAIELSYYGASVIHPKTVKPLQNKEIPLYVKSFVDPTAEGTVIQSSTTNDHLVPSFILKMDQVLYSITPKDFSFLVEKNLSDILARVDRANAKINVMQNSALNFSILVDAKISPEEFIKLFQDTYHVKYNVGLELITIRHYDQKTIDQLIEGKEVLLQQLTRETARIVAKKK